MKKIMKKRVSLFGKEVSLLLVVMIGMIALSSAALVSYLSNTITGTVDVSSPITIEITDVSSDGVFDNDAGTYSVSIYGGESFDVDINTIVHVDGVTGHISENKIMNFDGEGISIRYTDDNFPDGYWEIPVCTNDDDDHSYFYIGNPDEILSAGTLESTTTLVAALNLDPTQSLQVESKVIMADSAACDYDSPTFVDTTP